MQSSFKLSLWVYTHLRWTTFRSW
uniref:Uncharacterized protein n=1 Tax=Rhizophora mucronata TaxID=61149 RepID=A0A2P2QKQ2_RHIMU